MIVYMIINEIEERVYVGQTTHTLKERVHEHWKASRRETSTAPLHVAMRKWDDPTFWDAVVLANCYNQEELDATEAAWIAKCSSTEPGVGYNVSHGNTVKPRKERAWFSPSQAEFFRECGKKGAKYAKKKEDMTPEEREKFREWGRKGGAKMKERAVKKLELKTES